MRSVANLFSFSRIVISPLLLFFPLGSWQFLAIYFYCGMSDILDGGIARVSRCTSEEGAHADFVADMAFLFISLIVFLPKITVPFWQLAWLIGIIFFKAIAVLIAYDKFEKLILLIPTFLSKLSWFILFFVPLNNYLSEYIEENYLMLAFLVVASATVVEELSIILLCKQYDLKIRSIFMIDIK